MLRPIHLLAISGILFLTSCGDEVKLRVIETSEYSAKIEITYKISKEYAMGDIFFKDTAGRSFSFISAFELSGKEGCDTIQVNGLMPDRKSYIGCQIFINDKTVESEVVECTTKPLPEEAVDLGLSVKWASCNLGADSPYHAGNFYSWGNTAPSENYQLYTLQYTKDMNLVTDRPTGTYNLPKNLDAAAVTLGDGWRMPTKEEAKELVEKCEWSYVDINPRSWLVTGPSGKSIILPMVGYMDGNLRSNNHSAIRIAGYYWTSTSAEVDETSLPMFPKYTHNRAASLGLTEKAHFLSSDERHLGLPIRPVKN